LKDHVIYLGQVMKRFAYVIEDVGSTFVTPQESQKNSFVLTWETIVEDYEGHRLVEEEHYRTVSVTLKEIDLPQPLNVIAPILQKVVEDYEKDYKIEYISLIRENVVKSQNKKLQYLTSNSLVEEGADLRINCSIQAITKKRQELVEHLEKRLTEDNLPGFEIWH